MVGGEVQPDKTSSVYLSMLGAEKGILRNGGSDTMEKKPRRDKLETVTSKMPHWLIYEIDQNRKAIGKTRSEMIRINTERGLLNRQALLKYEIEHKKLELAFLEFELQKETSGLEIKKKDKELSDYDR